MSFLPPDVSTMRTKDLWYHLEIANANLRYTIPATPLDTASLLEFVKLVAVFEDELAKRNWESS